MNYFSGGDVEISEKKKKKKYVCQLPFKEQIEVKQNIIYARDV